MNQTATGPLSPISGNARPFSAMPLCYSDKGLTLGEVGSNLGTQDFTCERSDGKTVGVELTELLPRWPSGTAREPKSKRCNSAVRAGGHRGEQKTPTSACRHP